MWKLKDFHINGTLIKKCSYFKFSLCPRDVFYFLENGKFIIIISLSLENIPYSLSKLFMNMIFKETISKT